VGRTRKILRKYGRRVVKAGKRSFGTSHQLARLFAAEGILFTFIITIAQNNNNLYASRLGASSYDLGLLASLPPIIGMISLIPFAMITDRLRNKKPMVMYSAIGLGLIYILVGMVAFLQSDQIPVLIALLVLVNVPLSLYNSSWQTFFSDAVLPEDRNHVYSHRTRMNTAVGIVIPLVAGAILSAVSGSGKIMVHQIYYWLAFPLALGQVLILRKTYGGVAEETAHVGLSDLLDSARTLFRSRTFIGFLAVTFLVYAGWQLDWSLYFQAQFKYLHLNEAQMSLVLVLAAITQFAMLGVWSRLVQQKGVRFVFVIGACGFALGAIVMLMSLYMSPPFRTPFYLIMQSIAGCGFSAFQLSLLQCLLEAIPTKNRALSIAIYNAILMSSNVVMPFLGVYIYNLNGETLPSMIIAFWIVSIIRVAAVIAAYIRWFRMRKEDLTAVV
jgi:MFS family permease